MQVNMEKKDNLLSQNTIRTALIQKGRFKCQHPLPKIYPSSGKLPVLVQKQKVFTGFRDVSTFVLQKRKKVTGTENESYMYRNKRPLGISYYNRNIRKLLVQKLKVTKYKNKRSLLRKLPIQKHRKSN